MSSTADQPHRPASPLRPHTVRPVRLAELRSALQHRGLPVPQGGPATEELAFTGITIDSRSVEPGDLYIGLPGARRHGASFAAQADAAGAAAMLTDDDGARLAAENAPGLPVLRSADLRALVGPLAAAIYRSQPRGRRGPHAVRRDRDQRQDHHHLLHQFPAGGARDWAAD